MRSGREGANIAQLTSKEHCIIPPSILTGLECLTVSSKSFGFSDLILRSIFWILADTPLLTRLTIPHTKAHKRSEAGPPPVLPLLMFYHGPFAVSECLLPVALGLQEVILTEEVLAQRLLPILRSIPAEGVIRLEVELERWDDEDTRG